MATTSQYLQSLQNDMQTLKTNVAEKGVEVSDDDNFTTLSAKVADISGGGDEPTNITELNQSITNLLDDFDDYVYSLPNNYNTNSNNAITLYTPNINYKYYIIQKRSSGKYRIDWFNSARKLNTTGSTNISVLKIGANSVSINNIVNYKNEYSTTQYFDGDFCYYSNEYNTINDCINAIQDAQTYYNSANNYLGYEVDTPNVVPYTNTPIFNTNTNNFETNLAKISSNETIVQI